MAGQRANAWGCSAVPCAARRNRRSYAFVLTFLDFAHHGDTAFEVLHAMNTLLEKRLSGAPVVDDEGQLVGVLSKKGCLRAA